MQISYKFWTILLILTTLNACIKPDDFPPEPVITSIELSTNTIQNGAAGLIFYINFQDGDGDLGSLPEGDDTTNIFITDTRTDYLVGFNMPVIPPQGSVDDISGEIVVEYSNTCCIDGQFPYCVPDTTRPPYDTIYFDIQIRDQAGNKSNIITAGPVQVRCNE